MSCPIRSIYLWNSHFMCLCYGWHAAVTAAQCSNVCLSSAVVSFPAAACSIQWRPRSRRWMRRRQRAAASVTLDCRRVLWSIIPQNEHNWRDYRAMDVARGENRPGTSIGGRESGPTPSFTLLQDLALSCAISDIQRDISRKLRFLSRVSVLMRDTDIAIMSVCPSIRSSVLPSCFGILSKRLKVSSKFHHHTVAQSL